MKKVLNHSMFLLMGFALLISSCVPYKKAFKESQTLFNQSVSIETAYRVKQLEKQVTNPEPSLEAQASFQKTYDATVAFLTEHEVALKADNLYGNALALKSLSEFYLEKNTDANNTAAAAITYLEQSADNNKTRDLALMRSMSGLVLANQLYDKINVFDKNAPLDAVKFNTIMNMAKGAIDGIEKGREGISATHPTNEFLTMSELTVYKNWLDFIPYGVDEKSSDLARVENKAAQKAAYDQAKAAINRLDTATGGKKPALVKYWKELIGVS